VKSLADQLRSYRSYHRHPVNAAAHFAGVPLVILGLLVPLGWARLDPGGLPATPAAALVAAVLGYYLVLDFRMALVAVPFGLALLWAADGVSRWPLGESAAAASGLFVGGWAVQLAGHGVEGRRPALTDNLLQVFVAPLFLAAEFADFWGYRRDLHLAAGLHRPARPPTPPR
jgi:uncharacterized membrane protein YGL010W